MAYEELKKIFTEEHEKLDKGVPFLVSFYDQISDSLVSLRDNLFTHMFVSYQGWKSNIDTQVEGLEFPSFTLQSTEGRIQNNSEIIAKIISNISYIEEKYLRNFKIIRVQDVELIKRANLFLQDFIKHLYSPGNLSVLKDQRLALANTIKKTIEKNLDAHIIPFFESLDLLLRDEYKLALRNQLKRTVGSYTEYVQDPFKYDRIIKQKTVELQIEYDHALVLNTMTDLSKSDEAISKEIKDRYRVQEPKKQSGPLFRLKEIASRYISQESNLGRLKEFLTSANEVFQPLSVTERVFRFIARLLTGKRLPPPKKDVYYFYSTSKGKIEQKKTSIQSLVKEIIALENFYKKTRASIDFSSHSKNTKNATSKEIDHFIDKSMSSLENIYIKCIGLRDWLIRRENYNHLKRVPVKLQEAFNDILLNLNYNLIINKQALRDISERYK